MVYRMPLLKIIQNNKNESNSPVLICRWIEENIYLFIKRTSYTNLTYMKSLNAVEAWFITGSQDLYGPETLKQVAQAKAAWILVGFGCVGIDDQYPAI